MNANPIEITKDAVGGALRVGRWAAGEAVGTLNRVRGRGATGGPPKDLDDVTIARKVETVVFRPAGREKGKIDVNVVDGVVWLRGEAKTPADIEAIEASARAIPEVVDVQNLLHLPKTPARRARGSQRAAAKPRTPRRSVNADKTVAAEPAEPLPKDLAAEGEGRPPAPLGSEDTPSTSSAAPAPGGFTATNAAGEDAGEKS
jgi:BON domain